MVGDEARQRWYRVEIVSDTRRWPRMALALDVRMRFENRDQAMEARTLNISREGVFIQMDPPKPIGTRVRIAMHIEATHEKFVIEGVVVRCAPDVDEPLNPGEAPGIAVFLTHSSVGYTRFCDELARAKVDQAARDQEFANQVTDPAAAGPVVEAVRQQGGGKER